MHRPLIHSWARLCTLALLAGCSPGTQQGEGDEQTSAAPLQTRPQAPPTADAASAPPVTYYAHIKPILDAKCARCHVDGSVAPFALTSYALAKQYAEPARNAVNAGRMPPWKAAAGCNEYAGDFSLSTEEKRLLNAWVDRGAPDGDPAEEGPAIDLGDKGMSRVDLTLALPEPYTPRQRPDEYRCFPMEWPHKETAYMTGFHPVPGAPKIVHHIEVYHVPKQEAARVRALDQADPGPGYTCFSGPGAGTGTIGGWAPGSPGYDYPDGIGIQIDPGAVIVVQVHYNTTSAPPEPDRSKVEMKVDTRVTKGGYSFWTDWRWSIGRNMRIPAGASDVKHTYASDPTSMSGGRPITLYRIGLHMHSLGRAGYLKLKRRDGTEQCLLKIDDWDFHWQGGFLLERPIRVNPGDKIEMQCTFDNSGRPSAHGPSHAEAPRDVFWGEGTSDEMCLGNVLWGPAQ